MGADALLHCFTALRLTVLGSCREFMEADALFHSFIALRLNSWSAVLYIIVDRMAIIRNPLHKDLYQSSKNYLGLILAG